MKKIRLKGYGKTIFLFSLIAIMLVPAIISIGQKPIAPDHAQQTTKADLSDKDIYEFVNLYIKANNIQANSQIEIKKAIEKEGFSLTRFNEIMADSQKEDFSKISAKELASFNRAYEKIAAIQEEIQSAVGSLIEKEIGLQRYEQIIAAYSKDDKVQEKIDALLEQEKE
jgi:hypothetical protein